MDFDREKLRFVEKKYVGPYQQEMQRMYNAGGEDEFSSWLRDTHPEISAMLVRVEDDTLKWGTVLPIWIVLGIVLSLAGYSVLRKPRHSSDATHPSPAAALPKETCQYCRRTIANEEQAFVFRGDVACEQCDRRLRNEPTTASDVSGKKESQQG